MRVRMQPKEGLLSMKRVCALLCAMLLMMLGMPLALAQALPEDVLPVSLWDAEGMAVTEQEAMDQALALLREGHPDAKIEEDTTVCHANGVMLSDGSGAMMASVFCQSGWPLLYAVVTFSADSGQVIRYEETEEGWFTEPQENWEQRYGPYGQWPLEMQELYDILYCVEINHATLPEGAIGEEEAFALAVEAAGLAHQRNALTYERSLALNTYAVDSSETYVWIITLYQNNLEVAQVDLSAQDGHIIDLFTNESDLG